MYLWFKYKKWLDSDYSSVTDINTDQCFWNRLKGILEYHMINTTKPINLQCQLQVIIQHTSSLTSHICIYININTVPSMAMEPHMEKHRSELS